MDVLKALWSSRKAWVGAVTVLLTVLLNVFAASLGLTPEAVTQVSAAIVAAGLAVIGGIALDNRSEAGAGKAPIILALLLFLPLAGGCMAEAAVRQGQAEEARVLACYVSNVGRINDLTISMYESERAAAVGAATDDALKMVRAAAVGGMLPVKDFEESLLVVIRKREEANGQTKTVVSKVRGLVDKNNLELAKALRLHGAVTDWLETGIDASAMPGLISDAMTIFQTLKKPVAAGP